jgi:hypothetical protein
MFVLAGLSYALYLGATTFFGVVLPCGGRMASETEPRIGESEAGGAAPPAQPTVPTIIAGPGATINAGNTTSTTTVLSANSDKEWWKRPPGKVFLGVLVGVIAPLVVWLVIRHFDKPPSQGAVTAAPQTQAPRSSPVPNQEQQGRDNIQNDSIRQGSHSNLQQVTGTGNTVVGPTTITPSAPVLCRVEELRKCSSEDLQRNALDLASLVNGLDQELRNKKRLQDERLWTAGTPEEKAEAERVAQRMAPFEFQSALSWFRVQYMRDAQLYESELEQRVPGHGVNPAWPCFEPSAVFCDFHALAAYLRELAGGLQVQTSPSPKQLLSGFVEQLGALADQGNRFVQGCRAGPAPDPELQGRMQDWENNLRALVGPKLSEFKAAPDDLTYEFEPVSDGTTRRWCEEVRRQTEGSISMVRISIARLQGMEP